ncbi:MAG TPA: ABC transporter substrate-binding protein [Ktedonobacterales bacterium]
MFRSKQLIMATLSLSVLALALTACGSSTVAGPKQSVTLALDWTPNTNHTGIFVAQQKGYYANEGLTLSLAPYSSNVTPEQLVSTGQADFGISFTESVTAARATGLDVVSVAAVIQHNTSALVSLRSSGLDTLPKLQGKKYAGFGAPYEQPVIDKILSCAGVSKPAFENVTTDLDPIVALKSGQFDFAWIYSGWEGIEAQRQGVSLNIFPLGDTCMPDYYSPVIITSSKMLHAHPDTVRHFLAATAQGFAFAIHSPREAADLLIKGAPAGTFDDKQLVYDSQDYLSPRYAEGAPCWGTQTAQKWTEYPKFMFESGAIQDANGSPITTAPDYAAAFSNAYLPSC